MKTLHRSMHAMNNGTAYFATAVNYTSKMSMKLATGVDIINRFFVTNDVTK